MKKGLLTAAVLLLIALPFAHAAEGKVRLAIVGLDHGHVWGLLKVETYMFVSGTKGCRRERRWPSVRNPSCCRRAWTSPGVSPASCLPGV